MWVSNQCCILKIIGRTKVKQMLCFDNVNSRIQGEDPSLWIQPLYIPSWWFCGCWFIVYHCSRCLWFFVFGPCFCNAVLNVLSSFFHCGRESWLLSMLCVFPPSAVGWSMVCDCGISSVSWPYTHCLVFLCYQWWLYQCILLIEHFQRFGCVRNNQNEICCDAYS